MESGQRLQMPFYYTEPLTLPLVQLALAHVVIWQDTQAFISNTQTPPLPSLFSFLIIPTKAYELG